MVQPTRECVIEISDLHQIIHGQVMQGSHSRGKVMQSHGILNFHARPGKVVEFRKNCLSHGKVMKFRLWPNSF